MSKKNQTSKENLKDFYSNRSKEISNQSHDDKFRTLSESWFKKSTDFNYSYHFDWLSRPIIQYPQDMIALQEIIWKVKPDLIIETGIAHGGSLIYSASLLGMIDICKMYDQKTTLSYKDTNSLVLGIDIEIRKENKKLIKKHPLSNKIRMIEGDSIAENIVREVSEIAKNFNRILVCLDSNHSHKHVLEELKLYSKFVTKDSYCIVFDTAIENLKDNPIKGWGPGNSPRTAVNDFVKNNKNFEIDYSIDNKLMISVAKGGYLRKVR